MEAARSASSSCPCLCPLRGHGHKSEKRLRKEVRARFRKSVNWYLTNQLSNDKLSEVISQAEDSRCREA